MKYIKTKKLGGFTLIELLVVIAIIGILTGIIIPILRVGEYTKQARDARRINDLLNLQTTIIASITNNDISLIDTSDCNDCDSETGTILTDGTGWVKFENKSGDSFKKFINNLPTDPINKGKKIYSYFSDGNNFELNTILESEQYANYAQLDGGNDDSVYERGWDLDIE